MELPKRKPTRLKDYDYSTPGAYFVTVCAANKEKILSRVVGIGVLDGPQNILSEHGKIADKYINQMNDFYDNIHIDKYVIMPNHIHFLISILENANGPSGTPVPTKSRQNSAISRFVSTFKRFCNKEYGKNIWQYRSNDHIIRGEIDYKEIWQYIENNPLKWKEDKFYIE